MNVSHHAQTRSQQRGIAPMMIDFLEQFGTQQKTGDGAVKVFFDKAARRRIKAYAGPLARFIEEYMDLYAVVSGDGRLITVGHRIERIRRH